MRLAIAVMVVCLGAVHPVWAQGSFGDGGGSQGPMVGDGDVSNRQLFLSPGDKTEWSFEAKGHDGIQIEITSSVFDPAIAIVDEQGKKLAENDDIEPGNQMARIVFALPKAGKYRAVVTNYKGSAGGAFDFRATRFLVVDAPPNALTSMMLDDKAARAHLVVDKPGEYVIAQHGAARSAYLKIVNSRGVTLDDAIRFLPSTSGYVRCVFTAPEAGTYFAQFTTADKLAIRWLPVTMRAATTGQEVACDFGSDEVVHWTIPGKKWDIVQARLASDSPDARFTVRSRPDPDPEKRAFVDFDGAQTWERAVVAFLADSSVVIETAEMEGRATKAALRVERTGRPLPAPGRQESKLGWGDADIWTLRAKPGDVVRIKVVSSTYKVDVAALSPTGVSSWIASSGAPPVGATTLTVDSDGQYAFAVRGGGVGDYRLEVAVTPPRTLGEGVTRGELKADAPDVWRFHAGADEDVLFKIDGADGLSYGQVIGPDGKGAGATHLQDPKHGYLLRFISTTAGDYTLKIAAPNGGAYTIRRIPLRL